MKYKAAKWIKVDPPEVEAILAAIQSVLSEKQYSTVKQSFETLVWLQTAIREKSISIAKLSRMLFGKKTESMKNLKDCVGSKKNPCSANGNVNAPIVTPAQSANQTEEDDVADEKPKNENEKIEGVSQETSQPNETERKKGHGRKPLDAYKVTRLVHIPHDQLKTGQVCPLCNKGKLYQIDPQVLLLIKGQPPLKAEAYSAQGLRCNLCGQVFRATFPKEVISQPKADITARAIVSLAKYQLGTPLYRLETWQKIMKLPISDTEMWEWTESVALVLYPIRQTLLKIASCGNVIHNDDTKGRILDLMAANRLAQKGETSEKNRKGIFASCLLSITKEGYQIASYVTGHKNSGENLDDLLDLRPMDFQKPIQACDASSSNTAERHDTEIAHCLNHARHNFCEIVEEWPNEILHIIEMFNAVFMNDRKTKGMDIEKRLEFHRKESRPLMERLKKYCNDLLKNKIVEPNSNFAKAINYLNNHWEGLTLFLRNGLAPISNNNCERSVKSYVLIRKNAYFYKSCWGAMVGDILLSITRTCELNNINPYDYLVAIQANSDVAAKDPTDWLPWNYTKNTSAPYVDTHSSPIEEVYHNSATGPPTLIPVKAQPNLEEQKKTLRNRARDFFNCYYGREQAMSPT
jgi:transposase